MVDHAALYADPYDPLVIRVSLENGEAGIYELNLREEHGDDADEVPAEWTLVAELTDTTATGRGTGRARHGDELPTVHDAVCTPCDAARQVVEALAVELDPLDNWPDVEVDGMSVQDRLTAIVAGTLHTSLGVYTDPLDESA